MKIFLKTLFFFLLAVFMFNSYPVYSQSPQWSWVKQAGGINNAEGRSIALDGSGNSLVIGHFQGSVTFGDTTLNSLGDWDIFVAKYDENGNVLWAEQASGIDFIGGNGIAVDGSGNSLVTGEFFGNLTIGDTTLTSLGGSDIFVAKYDENGNFLWAEQAGGTLHVGGFAIAVDVSGNSLVTGHFEGSAIFGDTTLTSFGGSDIFVAKYDGNGNLLWVEQAGGTNYEVGFGIAVDGSGNSLVTGWFMGTATFGNTTLTNSGGPDIFIAKYDENGNFIWVEQAGGTDSQVGQGIAVDGSGNSLVTGWFMGTATFGDTTLTNLGGSDIFVAKYDENGNFIWAVQAGGINEEWGNGIAVDVSANILVTGSFLGSATFGDTTLTSLGGSDIFVAKYDENGNFLWAEQAGGINNDSGYDIAVDVSGNSLVTGSFEGSAAFGNITLTSAGGADIFVAKIEHVTIGLPEYPGNALNFDGVDDYVNCGDIGALAGISQLTIETWVKVDILNNYSTFISKSLSDEDRIHIQLSTDGLGGTDDFALSVSNGSNGFAYTDANVVQVGTLQHIAMVFDGTQVGDANRLKFYVNGIQQTLVFYSPGSVPATTPNNATSLLVGAETDGFLALDGLMDEVRIWNVARTEAEIQNNMYNSIDPITSGLVAYYPFNQGTAGGNNSGVTTLDDVTLNNNDGTLNNFALSGSTSNWVSSSAPITGIKDKQTQIPKEFSLSHNYPNPFNPSTKISYTIPERTKVSLKVFDLLGSEVIELVNGEVETGSYDITFNAANLPSGVYFYRLQAGVFVQTRKMILLK